MRSPRVATATLALLWLGTSACRRSDDAKRDGPLGSGPAPQASDASADPRAVRVAAVVAAASEAITASAPSGDVLPLVVVLADERSAGPLGAVFRDLPVAARFMVLPPSAGDEAALGRDADDLGQIAQRLLLGRPSRGKPILLGAGRGGSVALAYAARAPRALGAVIVVGAELPRSALPEGPVPEVGVPPLRVYIHHGSRDPVTPVARGGAASDELALRGLAAVLHLDPRAEHELSAHLVAEMRARLTEEIRDLP